MSTNANCDVSEQAFKALLALQDNSKQLENKVPDCEVLGPRECLQAMLVFCGRIEEPRLFTHSLATQLDQLQDIQIRLEAFHTHILEFSLLRELEPRHDWNSLQTLSRDVLNHTKKLRERKHAPTQADPLPLTQHEVEIYLSSIRDFHAQVSRDKNGLPKWLDRRPNKLPTHTRFEMEQVFSKVSRRHRHIERDQIQKLHGRLAAYYFDSKQYRMYPILQTHRPWSRFVLDLAQAEYEIRILLDDLSLSYDWQEARGKNLSPTDDYMLQYVPAGSASVLHDMKDVIYTLETLGVVSSTQNAARSIRILLSKQAADMERYINEISSLQKDIGTLQAHVTNVANLEKDSKTMKATIERYSQIHETEAGQLKELYETREKLRDAKLTIDILTHANEDLSTAKDNLSSDFRALHTKFANESNASEIFRLEREEAKRMNKELHLEIDRLRTQT